MKSRQITCCALTLMIGACLPDLPTPRSESPEDSLAATSSKSSELSRKKSGARGRGSSRSTSPATATAEAASDSAGTPMVVETADSIGPFVVNGQRFTVLWEREQLGADKHVRRVQIRDHKGVVHHEERFDPPMQANRPEWRASVSVNGLRGESDQGLMLYYRTHPSAPLSGLNVRIFSLQGSRLAPVGPQLSVRGSFRGLVPSREPHVMILLPDDRLDVEVWQGHFGLLVPFRIWLSGCTPARYNCIRPMIRRGDIVPGLSLLRVNVPERRAPIETTIPFYDAPEGPGIARIAIRPTSEVTIIEAAADVFNETVHGVNFIRTRREWLHVRIDGRDGWIHGAESFAAIGLPAAS